MTAITSNNTILASDELMPPLKVALAGLTMIQQSLLEFYFETREGKKQYIQVLPKDADAYIVIVTFEHKGFEQLLQRSELLFALIFGIEAAFCH